MKHKKFTVVVYSAKGDEDSHAHLIRGYIEVEGRRFRFSGITFGRIGGFNASVSFTRAAKRGLKELGLDENEVRELELSLQERLIQGDFTFKLHSAEHKHKF